MQKHFFLFAIFFSHLFAASAQDSVLEPAEKKDSTQYNYNKVMVIPFNPALYFSDADQELAKYNKKNARDISRSFRYGLDYDLNVRIVSQYETHPILQDTALQAKKDLLSIYDAISYKLEKPNSILQEEKKDENFWQKFDKKSNGKKEREAQQTTTGYKPNDENSRYMNVVLHHPEMLLYYAERYGTDLFVFINQFELKTNYDRCLDRASGNFEREVKTHFSIFDKYGNQLYGDVITVVFPSNSNNLDKIMQNNFPIINNYLAGKLPPKGKGK